jgi:hypothetical protein
MELNTFLRDREECKKLLAKATYIKLYHFLIKPVGIDCTVMLSVLMDKENKYEKHNKLIDNKWFDYSRTDIENVTGISIRKQTVIFNKLRKLNLIETKRIGLPSKIYFKINYDRLIELLHQYIEKLA